MLPPRILRRLVFPPLVLLFTVGAIVVSPLLFLIGLIATPSRRGRRRTLRLLWFGLSWLVMESLALTACLGLWIASGFGGRLRSEASMDRHYGLVRWFLSTLFNRAVAVFQLRIEVDEPPLTAEEQAARLARPVIVLARHAGPGDSFLLVHQLPTPAAHRDEGRAAVRPQHRRGHQPTAARVRPSTSDRAGSA
jgi:hypothetical protein